MINPFVIFAVYGLGFIVVLGILVYLVIRRFKLKDEETFEKRDN
jgi:flagellar biosynthesis/type III secretory pathway M-ring protein FliF/YscJ